MLSAQGTAGTSIGTARGGGQQRPQQYGDCSGSQRPDGGKKGGPSDMRAEDLKGWLWETTRK